MSTISTDELRRLRNDVPMAVVIDALGLERSSRGARPSFRCPRCDAYHTAVNERTNLARCFRCEQNYNPIDLVLAVRGGSFLDAVTDLRAIGAAVGGDALRTVAT